MKKPNKIMTMAVVATAAAVFTGCSSDDEFLTSYEESVPKTRATPNPDGSYTITFDDFDESLMANTTSYGANYYESLPGYPQVTYIYDNDGLFESVINEHVSITTDEEEQSFMYGGIALSNWAMTANPSSNPNPGEPFNSDWWMSQYNQMSVYNTARTATGERGGAGAGGSNNFGVVFGYDGYDGWIQEASFSLPEGSTLKSMKICNTAYTYGVIQHGNEWYEDGKSSGTAKSLKDTHGYLKLTIKCIDGSNTVVKRVEAYLADYRNGKNICPTVWTTININADSVETVKFEFEGSDTDPVYGLNTPAYVAIDDIVLTNETF